MKCTKNYYSCSFQWFSAINCKKERSYFTSSRSTICNNIFSPSGHFLRLTAIQFLTKWFQGEEYFSCRWSIEINGRPLKVLKCVFFGIFTHSFLRRYLTRSVRIFFCLFLPRSTFYITLTLLWMTIFSSFRWWIFQRGSSQENEGQSITQS